MAGTPPKGPRASERPSRGVSGRFVTEPPGRPRRSAGREFVIGPTVPREQRSRSASDEDQDCRDRDQEP
jgi:hypothetical protein